MDKSVIEGMATWWNKPFDAAWAQQVTRRMLYEKAAEDVGFLIEKVKVQEKAIERLCERLGAEGKYR